jgi:hypothetical protein
MRLAISVLAGLVAIAHLDASDRHATSNPLARIRPMQKVGEQLLAEGIAHSPTFRWLVDRLNHSNVIVYVDVRPDMPPHLGGSLRFLARSATDHFLKIQLNRKFQGKILVALLAHELQHAVEVAEEGNIGSAEDLRRLYRRVGVRTGFDRYDTVAARQAGYIVRDELGRTQRVDFSLARRADAEPLPEADDHPAATESVPPSSRVLPENAGDLVNLER